MRTTGNLHDISGPIRNNPCVKRVYLHSLLSLHINSSDVLLNLSVHSALTSLYFFKSSQLALLALINRLYIYGNTRYGNKWQNTLTHHHLTRHQNQCGTLFQIETLRNNFEPQWERDLTVPSPSVSVSFPPNPLGFSSHCHTPLCCQHGHHTQQWGKPAPTARPRPELRVKASHA